MASKKKKIRAQFRKKYDSRTRQRDLTRGFREHGFEEDETVQTERVSGKGERYLDECRAQIEAAQRLRVEENAAVFDEDLARIEHRLASGEILSPEEYYARLDGSQGD